MSSGRSLTIRQCGFGRRTGSAEHPPWWPRRRPPRLRPHRDRPSDPLLFFQSTPIAAGNRTGELANRSEPDFVLPALAEHLERYTPAEPDAFVLTGTTGVPLTGGVLQKAWHKARLAIGRPELHLHDLRNTGLTLAAATGATTAELMHGAGHASPDAALRYQHATKDRDRVLAEALAKLATPAPVVPIAPQTAVRSRPDRAHDDS